MMWISSELVALVTARFDGWLYFPLQLRPRWELRGNFGASHQGSGVGPRTVERGGARPTCQALGHRLTDHPGEVTPDRVPSLSSNAAGKQAWIQNTNQRINALCGRCSGSRTGLCWLPLFPLPLSAYSAFRVVSGARHPMSVAKRQNSRRRSVPSISLFLSREAI